jgi:hypothetical protein
MPKLTISAGATGTIPAIKPLTSPQRKSLVFTLISGDAWWGWTPTVTASGNTDAGIPMATGAPVSLSSDTLQFNAAVNIFSTSGCVIHYQEKLI